MKYEDVVVKENTHKCYNIIYKHDGVEYDIIAQVYNEGEFTGIDFGVNMYIYDDNFHIIPDIDFALPLIKGNVVEIKDEVFIESTQEEYSDSFSKMDFESVKHLETKCPNVYLCKSVEDLELLYKSLNEPIIIDVDYDVEIDRDFFESVLLNATSGSVLVYYYSEYDDFSCYGDGFTHMIKIINV